MLRPKNIIQPAVRYPADPRAVFILALSVFSGISTLIAREGPDSIEALLPHWGVVTWAVTLGLGSFMALLGLARDTDWGIVTEQVGCVMVGVATTFYSILVLMVVGPSATPAVSIILGWGLACFLRWLQLQLLIHQHIEERFRSQIEDQILNANDEEQ